MSAAKCQRCGKEFESSRSDAKWCSECQPIKRREQGRDNAKRYRQQRKGKYKCPLCGEAKDKDASCCWKCYQKSNKGETHHSWKGGKNMHADGYVQIRKPPGYKGEGKHPYILEHRYIWEQAFGPIPKGIILHHLNGDKTDNRLENLCALHRNEHNPKLILEPFRKRINELETQVKQLKVKERYGYNTNSTGESRT